MLSHSDMSNGVTAAGAGSLLNFPVLDNAGQSISKELKLAKTLWCKQRHDSQEGIRL